MAARLALVGVDIADHDWLSAVEQLTAAGEILPVAAGHPRGAHARDVGDRLHIPATDDLRQLLNDYTPDIVLLDRPTTVPLDFLTACIARKTAIFSLGPPVFNLGEAQTLAAVLEPVTPYLTVWPTLRNEPIAAHLQAGEEFIKPVRFVAAEWLACNAALQRTSATPSLSVRSLASLAWDALGTLISLLGVPESVYAALRGTVGASDNFADISGAVTLTLRFADEVIASVVLSDLTGPFARSLRMIGQQGEALLTPHGTELHDAKRALVERTAFDETGSPAVSKPIDALRAFLAMLNESTAAGSPRGRAHYLEPIAASLEAMIVSNRAGDEESPLRLLKLWR
jgi:predicted dehydrogenase